MGCHFKYYCSAGACAYFTLGLCNPYIIDIQKSFFSNAIFNTTARKWSLCSSTIFSKTMGSPAGHGFIMLSLLGLRSCTSPSSSLFI